MQILEIEKSYTEKEILEYRVWLEHNGIKFYMYIDEVTFYNPKNFKKWLDTLIETTVEYTR